MSGSLISSMAHKNDERYWNIKKLNKWFAISSILFLLSYVWIFYHDNDDEFKRYQREFRKLEIEVSNKKLESALSNVQDQRVEYEEKYNLELDKYNSKMVEVDSLKSNLEYVKGLFYKANMDYLFKKAEFFVNVSFDALAIFPATEDKRILQNLTGFSLNRSF